MLYTYLKCFTLIIVNLFLHRFTCYLLPSTSSINQNVFLTLKSSIKQDDKYDGNPPLKMRTYSVINTLAHRSLYNTSFHVTAIKVNMRESDENSFYATDLKSVA